MRRIRHREHLQITDRVHPPVRMETCDTGPSRQGGQRGRYKKELFAPHSASRFLLPLGHAERDGLCSAWARRSAAMSPWAACWASDRAELPPCGEGAGEDITARIPASHPGHPHNPVRSILNSPHFLAPSLLREAVCSLPADKFFPALQ